MPLRRHQNIPDAFTRLGRDVVNFIQTLLDYQHGLIQTGTRISWKSTAEPSGGYIELDGSVITNADYPDLIEYAANDSTFTVGATTTTLPTEANTWIKT